jgi:hypothetical protein
MVAGSDELWPLPECCWFDLITAVEKGYFMLNV